MIKYLETQCENCKYWVGDPGLMELEGTCWKIVPITKDDTAWAGILVNDPYTPAEFRTDFSFYCNLWEGKGEVLHDLEPKDPGMDVE